MTFKKFTHTLLKHYQTSRRTSVECRERNHVLKNTNADLQK